MILINKIIKNFREWRCKLLDDDLIMYSRQFSDKTHQELRGNFHSAFNSFTKGDKTIIVCCFSTYTNIVIFQPSNRKSNKFIAATAYES